MKSFPTLQFGPVESHARIVFPQTLKKASKLFLENGALLVKNVFSAEHIRDLHDEYCRGYSSYFQDGVCDDALTVGDKRRMVTVTLEGGFNDPELYANSFIFPLLQHLLGQDMILGSCGSVVARPGAEEQHTHRDLPHLFDIGNTSSEGNETKLNLPPYAITLFIPLVQITAANGPTRMWLGSHRRESENTEGQEFFDPVTVTGDAIIFDYRLMHAGLANRTDQARSVIYNVYSRPWFRDWGNYQKQKALVMSDEEFDKVPESYRRLFVLSR